MNYFNIRLTFNIQNIKTKFRNKYNCKKIKTKNMIFIFIFVLVMIIKY